MTMTPPDPRTDEPPSPRLPPSPVVPPSPATLDWNAALVDQLELHWSHHLRPRLDGLPDQEHFWEPVPGCWSIRARGTSSAPIAAGEGDFVMEYAFPEPEIPPVTTIGRAHDARIAGVRSLGEEGLARPARPRPPHQRRRPLPQPGAAS
ncbi:MAG: hypothetical protein ACYCVZ_03160 [Streptosporangiaceae bacterium]